MWQIDLKLWKDSVLKMPLDKNSTFYDSQRNYTHYTEALLEVLI